MEILLFGADGQLGLYDYSSEDKEKVFTGFAAGTKATQESEEPATKDDYKAAIEYTQKAARG